MLAYELYLQSIEIPSSFQLGSYLPTTTSSFWVTNMNWKFPFSIEGFMDLCAGSCSHFSQLLEDINFYPPTPQKKEEFVNPFVIYIQCYNLNPTALFGYTMRRVRYIIFMIFQIKSKRSQWVYLFEGFCQNSKQTHRL